MSIVNRHVSHYKYFNPLPQKKNAACNFRMPNATAEEIFQAQNINIRNLENKVSELSKQIKELKLENKTLFKANTLQEKELKKANESSTGIPFLTLSYKEEIRTIQSKVSSLQDQLKMSENNLKSQEKIALRKSLQIENLSASKRQCEKHIKEMALENKELKNGKELISKEYQELLGLNKELKLKNEELQQKIEQAASKASELEGKLKTAESNEAQFKEDLNKLKKSYDELQQNFYKQEQCPTLMNAVETQTDGISSLYSVFDGGLKACFKKSEFGGDDLNAVGDYWDDDEFFKTKGVQKENSILASDSSCKTKLSGFHTHQDELTSNLPVLKIQKSLLKPMKSRPPCSLKTHNNASNFLPIDPYVIKPFTSANSLSVSSEFLQSDYPAKDVFTMKYFSPKMC